MSSVFGVKSGNLQELLDPAGNVPVQQISSWIQNAAGSQSLIKQYGDRFIPKRCMDSNTLKAKIYFERKTGENSADSIFLQHPHAWRLKSYKELLSVTCHVDEEHPEPVLRFSRGHSRPVSPHIHSTSWPCQPRKRPVILHPDIIFDLPGYEDFMNFEVLDWGMRDFLVAGLDDQLFMLESSTSRVTKLHTLEYPVDSIYVVKWDPDGINIAIGTHLGRLYIFDSTSGDLRSIPLNQYQLKKERNLPVTALDWHPKGFILACCTGLGSLCLFDIRSKKRPKIIPKAHLGDINRCFFSPNGEYLVTSGEDGNVRIWHIPDVKPFFQVVYAHETKAFAWHPWRGCQLAIGGHSGHPRGHGDGSLSVWDVSLQSNICHQLPSLSCAVDSLAWSQLTGELVASYWVKGNRPGSEERLRGHSRILVLSAPGKITDEMSSPTGRTKILLFNPDGTKLATASSDENLFIWNFLGSEGPLLETHKRNIKKNNNTFKLREINEFNNFGHTIR